MLACASGGFLVPLVVLAIATAAILPISLGALTAVLKRPGRDVPALWKIGSLATCVGLVELAFGVGWWPLGLYGLIQAIVGGVTLAKNDPGRN